MQKESGLSDAQCVQVLRSEVNKRNEAALAFEKGGRREMAEKEKKEAEILMSYLPAELSDEELSRIITSKIEELGIQRNEKNFGLLMKTVVAAAGEQASGERIAQAVKQILRG